MPLNIEDVYQALNNAGYVHDKKNPAIVKLAQQILIASTFHYEVLILGETGTGKDLVYECICQLRNEDPKIRHILDCGTLNEGNFQSELFGHMKGAFAGAVTDKLGIMATCGTVFLDEIHNLTIPMQNALLRAIQNHEIRKVGNNKATKYDFKLICATNQNLEELIEKGHFKEDFFHRINTIRIELPTLAQVGSSNLTNNRLVEIAFLSDVVLENHKKQLLKDQTIMERLDNSVIKFIKKAKLSDSVKSKFQQYPWPGNMRELVNVIQSLFISAISNPDLLNPSEPFLITDDLLPSSIPELIQDISDIPKPNDFSDIDISNMEYLIEKLARHYHDCWRYKRASQHIKMGRQHSKTTNPFMVPWENLPESEKNLNINAAKDCLRLIKYNRYAIVNDENNPKTCVFGKLSSGSLKEQISELEELLITEVARETKKITEAAEKLGFTREWLSRKVNREEKYKHLFKK